MTPVTWLRTSYWVGAVADAVIGIVMLIPGRMGETEFEYPMGLAAALMFGWTVLLIWADRKPMERKAILLITVFPVITGLLLSGIYAVATGLLPAGRKDIERVKRAVSWCPLGCEIPREVLRGSSVRLDCGRTKGCRTRLMTETPRSSE
jgi:hypothetical protein